MTTTRAICLEALAHFRTDGGGRQDFVIQPRVLQGSSHGLLGARHVRGEELGLGRGARIGFCSPAAWLCSRFGPGTCRIGQSGGRDGFGAGQQSVADDIAVMFAFGSWRGDTLDAGLACVARVENLRQGLCLVFVVVRRGRAPRPRRRP